MKTFSHLWQYLAEISLEWKIIYTKIVEKIKTHILNSPTSAVYEITSKNLVEPERPQMTTYGAYALHAGSARLHARTVHEHAYVPGHPHTCAHTDKYVIFNNFLWQKWFRERASMLRYINVLPLFCGLW